MRASRSSKAKSPILVPISILFLLFGCAPIPAAEPTPLIPETGFTQVAPTKAATEAEPTEPPLQIALTAVKFAAKVFKNGDTETEVEEHQKVDVEANDRIEVVKLENQKEQSHSTLHFSDFLKIDLFTNAVVLLEDVREEAGGSTHITLSLSRGHMFVELNDKTRSRVTVETPDSTINTLEDGTEFNICKAPDKLTCVGVTKGAVELITKGKKEILHAEEARFIFKDELPSPAICAPNEIFLAWKEVYRQSVNAPTLSAMVAGLQQPCGWQSLQLPMNARTLYQDQFTNAFTGWLQEKNNNHFIGYTTPEYYHVQIQGPGEHAVVEVPNRSKYSDVNVDLKALTGNAKSGDFQYGVVFRRSGDQYYAFAVSPSTKKWHVLKSSSNGLEMLKESINPGIRGLETEDTLRVVAKGSLFTFFINGQLVYQLIDFDYADGEVGLFVQTMDSPSAMIYFDSIVIWNMPGPASNSTAQSKELCFNEKDDDSDRFVDRDDPDCNRRYDLPAPSDASTASTAEPPTIEPPTIVPPTQPPPTEPPPTEPPPTDPPSGPGPTEPPVEPPPTNPPAESPPTEPPT